MINKEKLFESPHLRFPAQYCLEYYDKYIAGTEKDIPENGNAVFEDAHVRSAHQQLLSKGVISGTDTLKSDMEELRRILFAE